MIWTGTVLDTDRPDNNDSDRDSVGYRSSQKYCYCWYVYNMFTGTVLDWDCLKILLHHGEERVEWYILYDVIYLLFLITSKFFSIMETKVMMFQIVVWYNKVMMASETTKLRCFKFLYDTVVLIISINVVSINVVVTSEFFWGPAILCSL